MGVNALEENSGQVAAHLVPPDTWILDDELALKFMLTAVIRQEAKWAAREEQWRDGQLDHAGDVLGRTLAWAWRTDRDAIFMRAITDTPLSLVTLPVGHSHSTTFDSA